MRVLFLTHRLPYPPNRGDRVRSYQIVRALASHVELTIISLTHDREESAHADDLRKFGVEVAFFEVPRWTNRFKAAMHLAGNRPLTHVLLDAPGLRSALQRLTITRRPDVVLAYCSGMARFGMEPPLDRFPLVVDMVDVDSAKWAALAQVAGWPKRSVYRREARLLSQFERETTTRAFCTLVVNAREAQTLEQMTPDATIQVMPNGVDLGALAPAAALKTSADVVFCGVMNYQPNVEAVLWFARHVWPRIKQRRPDARFVVVGSDPVSGIRRAAQDDSGIVVTGTVNDVRPHLWNAAVSVAPLTTARGVQNKVLEAVAAGLPVVVTSQVFEGLPAEVRPACRVAESVEDFATETLSLLDLTGEARQVLVRQADLRPLSWETQLAPLRDILEAAAGKTGVRFRKS
jgi:sugar transferase (PEP-CTERM/EpsH1 system associated)